MLRTTSLLASAIATTAVAALATSGLSPAAAAAPDVRVKQVAAPADLKVKGLSTDGKLLKFKLSKPGDVTKLDISGLNLDTGLVGIDFRPANGRLYGVGDLGGIYRISNRTGVATQVSQLTVPLDGEQFGVDFNPAVDRLRIVSDTGQNLRHDVDGDLTTPDGGLTTPPATEATTGVGAAAYLNNDASTATGTLLYDLNVATDQLVTQTPANAGTLTGIGALGVDAVGAAGFDIYSVIAGEGEAARTVGNAGLVALKVRATYKVYGIDLTSGAVTKVKGFAKGTNIADLAITPAG